MERFLIKYCSIAFLTICIALVLVSSLDRKFIKLAIRPPSSSMGVEQYHRNARPKIFLDSLTNDSTYCFQYEFRDPKGNPTIWRWSYDRYLVDSMSKAYGLPSNYFKPYKATSSVRKKRLRIRKRALFTKVDKYVVPDYNAIIKYHRKFTKPLYDLVNLTLGDSASKEDKLELILKFCQDLPYRIPPTEYKNKIVEGLFPPSLSLKLGYGDCDTKAMIFASALSHSSDYDMLVLTVPNHVLMAIKGIPKPYQESIEYQGEKYILCQPVGPARLRFGDKGSNYRPSERITAIRKFVKPKVALTATNSESATTTTDKSSD